MSQLISSASRSPRFWLAILFFVVPLVSATLLSGAAHPSDAAPATEALWGEPTEPWTPVPLDATTDGTIIVRKVAYPRSTTQTFTFTGDVSGTIGNLGTLTVTDLPAPGTYTSTEQVPAGWSLNSIQCDNGWTTYGGTTAQFSVDVGQTRQCTFYNQEVGSGPCFEAIGFLNTPGQAQNVAVVGGFAFVADGGAGLRVIDVSLPSFPVEVGFVDTPGAARDVVTAGDFAYVADGDSGLRVVDISTPSSPVEVGFLSTPEYSYGVAVASGHAYVANNAGLLVIDVSIPSAPIEIGNLLLQGSALDVAVAGEYAYVTVDGAVMSVVDVSTPSSPVEIGALGGGAYAIAVVGNHAYVTNSFDGLRVIDVSLPSSPVEVGFVDSWGFAYNVAVAGDFAYVAEEEGTLRVIDVSSPTYPIEVGAFDTSGFALGIAVSSCWAFVADWFGMTVFGDCDALFCDGLESGDTTGWDATSP